jgi:hypothetical protein
MEARLENIRMGHCWHQESALATSGFIEVRHDTLTTEFLLSHDLRGSSEAEALNKALKLEA